MLTVTGSSISWVFIFAAELLLFLLSSRISAPSSEVLQELVLTSEYSEGTALIGRGGFLGEELFCVVLGVRTNVELHEDSGESPLPESRLGEAPWVLIP